MISSASYTTNIKKGPSRKSVKKGPWTSFVFTRAPSEVSSKDDLLRNTRHGITAGLRSI